MNEFRLPYHLIVESGVFRRIPEAMEDVFPTLENQKTILVTEANLEGIFGDILDEIQEDFPNSERFLITGSGYDDATALAKHITMENITLVIGFGGGTVLDIAKFAAFVSKSQLISLVTTLSNDSLASPVAVLGTVGKARKTFKCTIPDAILVDVDVIKSAPNRQILAGIGDTLSKYTALEDWKLAQEDGSERVDDFSYMISKMALGSVSYYEDTDVKSDDFIKLLTRALVMGGLAMEIAGNSRPSSGSEHLFCHALEEEFSEYVNVPHGIAVAMGSYGACIFQGRDLNRVEKVIRHYGIPVKPSDWKVTEEIFVKAWQGAAASRPDRFTILNTADLSDDRLKAIYREMEEKF